MRKIILIMILGIFMLSLVGATDINDYYKLNTNIDYKKPCFNNGTYCSNLATCNFSVYDNYNNIIINNLEGTNNLAYHNISFTISNLGTYTVDMTCVDGSLKGSETFYFEVTPSGFKNTLGFYFLIFIFSTSLIILGFSIKDGWFVILGSFGIVLIGLFILFFGIDIIKDATYTWGLGIIILMSGAYLGIRASIEQLEL